MDLMIRERISSGVSSAIVKHPTGTVRKACDWPAVSSTIKLALYVGLMLRPCDSLLELRGASSGQSSEDAPTRFPRWCSRSGSSFIEVKWAPSPSAVRADIWSCCYNSRGTCKFVGGNLPRTYLLKSSDPRLDLVSPRCWTMIDACESVLMPDVILITGAAGFIGTALTKQLVEQELTVVAVDSLHPQVHASGAWPSDYPTVAARYTRDVTMPATWDEVFDAWHPDVVVHLAAETGTGQSLTLSTRHGRVNVVGTTELLDGLTRAGHVPRKFVLSSSRAVYGEGAWADAAGTPFYPPGRSAARLEAGEWTPLAPSDAVNPVHPLPHDGATVEPRPSNIYAATKLAQEHILAAWTSAMNAELTVLRFQNVYGPGQSLTNPYTGVVSLFGRVALGGEPINVYEDGGIVRDFVYVDDVVAALVAALAGGGSEHALDIGSGAPACLLEVAATVARLADAPTPIVSGKFRPGDVRAAFADISGARAALGYQPQVTLEDGLGRLLHWIKEEEGQAGN